MQESSGSFPRWGTHGSILKLEVLVKDVLGFDTVPEVQCGPGSPDLERASGEGAQILLVPEGLYHLGFVF